MVKIYKENVPERGWEKMEVKLYNKYAYDYLYTRDGEEKREGVKTRVRQRGLERNSSRPST